MPVIRWMENSETVRPGLTRRLAYLDHLMVAVLDFTDGPWERPEPPHSHPHEQISFVAEGRLVFYCEGEEPQEIGPGDVFLVPSDKKHSIRLLTETTRLVDAFSPNREDFL